MFPFFQSGADIQLLHSRSPLSDLFKKKETAGHQKIVKKAQWSQNIQIFFKGTFLSENMTKSFTF